MDGRLPLFCSSPPSQVPPSSCRIHAQRAMQPNWYHRRRLSCRLWSTGRLHRLPHHQLDCPIKVRAGAIDYRLHHRYNRGVLTAVFGWVCDWWDCAHRRDDWRAADFSGCAAGDAVEERSDKVLRVGGDSGDEYDNLPGFLSHLMMSMLSLFILLFILNSTRV